MRRKGTTKYMGSIKENANNLIIKQIHNKKFIEISY